nr:PREDICTED: uncharacterized protein LOC103985581 isoform X3 [Musa acuminata subsp. malaccensis]
MAAAAMGKIERAHRMYREGCHEVALGLYTDALAMAKTKAQKIALHSNRAACYLKLHDFKKSLAPIPESEEEASSLEENEEEVQPKGTRTQSEEERKVDPADEKPEAPVTQPANTEEASANTSSKPQGWEAIPKPKGHSGLDYSRWDRVEDDSSEEEEDDTEDQQPRSFNRPSGHILIKVVLRHKQHAGHLVLTPIDSLSWGVL